MKQVRDAKKVTQGMSVQDSAQSRFDGDDFEEALSLYVEAEKLYRDGFILPGDRVFFMQSTALRCLEELMEGGRLDLYDTYQEKAKAFFEEWSEGQINSRITPDQRENAFAFRLWRASHFRISPEFYGANVAIEHGDYEGARHILDGFILKLEENPYPESDALCAIARSKREIITLREELRKKEDQRDISIIAKAYARAAEASQLPENSTSQQHARIETFRNWFLSESLKFKAFAFLKDERMTDPVPSLSEAERCLATAAEHAKQAIASPSGGDFPKAHHSYLRYWHGIVSQRLHLLRFMMSGNEEEFNSSVEQWQNALGVAKEFLESRREEAIFPNRFYSLRDLELEELFLKAAYAFWQQRWSDCIDNLESYREGFPIEYRWSWRDIQIYIRLLFAKALHAFVEINSQELVDVCMELDRLRVEPVGNIGRFLIDEAQRLRMKQGMALEEQYVTLLCTCFPLDSYTDNYQSESDVDPFLSLPQRIYSWLEQTRFPSTTTELVEFKAKMQGCIEALLGYICDYHLQHLNLAEAAPWPDLDALIATFSRLVETCWGERRKLATSLEDLKEAIDELRAAEELESYRRAYEKAHGDLGEVIRLAPVVVEIKSARPSEKEPRGIEAVPDWMLSRQRLGREKLFIFLSPEISLEPGTYYLPPEWRKGNRVSYYVSKSQLMLYVRYQPDWQFWETEAARASLLLIEGISFEHLKMAIELSELCVGEDEKIHPKVGAVIVKEGKIVSQAFRNQDGKGGHAEEIAIERCREKDLKGATIITTLEPCTSRGHRSKRTCAEMIWHCGLQKVVFGIPDPNPEIRKKGELTLFKNNILVARFPSQLSMEIWNLNEAFIKKHTEDKFRTMIV